MHCRYQNLGSSWILGVKTDNCIFRNPQGHILTPKHAFWCITRPNRSTGWVWPVSVVFGCAGKVVCEPISTKFGSLVVWFDHLKCVTFHRPPISEISEVGDFRFSGS